MDLSRARKAIRVARSHLERGKKNHYEKADLASKLFRDAVVSRDVGALLRELNELRKDVSYDEPGPELEAVDLEGLAAELEAFVDEVEGILDGLEEK